MPISIIFDFDFSTMRLSKKTLLTFLTLGVLGLGLVYYKGWHIRIYQGVQNRLISGGVVQPKALGIADFEQVTLTPADMDAIRLTDASGTEHTLSDFKEDVLFFNYWASWCAPCVAEMPGIMGLSENLKGQVDFVMINRDRTLEKARQFLDREGYDFAIYKLQGPAPEPFRTGSIPLTLVLDRKTGTVYRHLGMVGFDTPENRDFLKALAR